MSDESQEPKKYPVASSEVAQMLGLDSAAVNNAPTTSADTHATHHGAPAANLPVVEEHSEPAAHSSHNAHSSHGEPETLEEKSANKPVLVKIAKAVLPFVVVFVVGLFLYFYFFSTKQFGPILSSTPSASTPKETALEKLEKQDLAAYGVWIKSFYYNVSDAKILDPESDNSGNGLSNFQKYLLNLNPKAYDTLGLGMADSQAIAMGINPSTGTNLTETQKDIISKYIDMEVVNNRLALNNLQHPSSVAGATVVNGNNSNSNTDDDVQIVSNGNSNSNGSNNYNNNNNSYTNPISSNSVDVNMDVPGRLEIPDLKVNAPLIWSKDPKDFDKDLQIGVIHYPGTGVPGDIGTTYISGHSSNYVWAKGNFNHVFTHLGDLKDNTSFKITVVQKNGKDAIFHYVVVKRKEYSPTDPEQYQNTGKSLVALSTCWPVGSTAKRLVVFGELTQVEK